MFSDRHRDDAVLLDEIWDAKSGSTQATTESQSSDSQRLREAIRNLEAGAPMMSTSQRERIRAKVQFPAATLGTSTTGIPATLDAAPLPVSLPIARRRRLDHPFLQIAATILLLLGIAGAWFVVRPNNSEHQSSPGIIAGSPSPEITQPPALAIVTVPRADEPQNLYLRIRRIVLAPGARWNGADSSSASDSLFIDRGLVSGTIEIEGANGSVVTVDGLSNPGSLRALAGSNRTVTNTGYTDAVLLELSAWISTQTNPQIAISEGAPELPAPPAGSTAEAVGGTDYTTLTKEDSTFMLNSATGFPVGPTWIGSASFQTIFGVIEFGTFRTPGAAGNTGELVSPAPESSPIAGAEMLKGIYRAGIMIGSSPGTFPSLVPDSGESSMLLISVRQVTVQDLAQRGEQVYMSSTGAPINLDVRTVTIQPGGTFSFRMSGSVIAWGLSGTASMRSDPTKDAIAIIPDYFASSEGSAEFSISALGDKPATFVLARASTTEITDLEPTDVSSSFVGTGTITLPEGELYVSLRISSQGYYSSNFLDDAAQLSMVLSSNVEFRATTDMVIHTQQGEIDKPAFSDALALQTGEWFFAEPGDGWDITINDPGNSQVIEFVVGSTVPSSAATLSASPITNESGTPLDISYDECVVTPRSLDEYEQILAVPYADGDPAVNHRGETGEITADESIIAGVTNTMRQVIACNDPSTSYQGYSLYSESAIRYQASIGNLSLSDIKSSAVESGSTLNQRGPAAGQLLVNRVEVFPDGRVGAWVSAAAEIAYVTFVFEDGQWLIDYWDDSSDSATPIP
jgi:hypothetical protein